MYIYLLKRFQVRFVNYILKYCTSVQTVQKWIETPVPEGTGGRWPSGMISRNYSAAG